MLPQEPFPTEAGVPAHFSFLTQSSILCSSHSTTHMWRARYGGGNGVRFSFSVLMELFLHASGWPVMLLTSMFSSGEFQGRGNEQVHVLPPFLALQHFIRTQSPSYIITPHFGENWDENRGQSYAFGRQISVVFSQGFACLKSLTIICKANPGDT